MKKWRLSIIAALIAIVSVAYVSIDNSAAGKAVTDGPFEYVGPEPSTLVYAEDPDNYVLAPPPGSSGCSSGCGLLGNKLCGLRNVAIGLDGKPEITQQIKDELGNWFCCQIKGPHLCFKF